MQKNLYRVFCREKHVITGSYDQVVRGCPVCRIGKNIPHKIHEGVNFIYGEQNLIRMTCADCGEVIMVHYSEVSKMLPCDLGHAQYHPDDLLRIKIIAALELVLGVTCSDWMFHTSANWCGAGSMFACSMQYKVVALSVPFQKYEEAIDMASDYRQKASDFNFIRLVDPYKPDRKPFEWAAIWLDVDKTYKECVDAIASAVNAHDWLRDHHRKYEPLLTDTPKLFANTVHPPFPEPELRYKK